jgi:hypothetical protein
MRGLKVFVGAVLVIAAAGLLLVHTCASGGAMAGAYQTCQCRGIEWEQYDQTAADGPRKTWCFGWVASRECYQFMDGPEVPCWR